MWFTTRSSPSRSKRLSTQGLAYLHHDCKPRIIHRDIKSNNILLDENAEAHVGDFGLAKVIDMPQSKSMSAVAGSYGYIAPDVGILDSRLDLEGDDRVVNHMLSVLKVAIMCTNMSPFDRPSMREVVSMLIESNERVGNLVSLPDDDPSTLDEHLPPIEESSNEIQDLCVFQLRSEIHKDPTWERERGVKEKELNRNKKHSALGIDVFTDSEDTMNDDTPIGVASAVREGVTPSVVDMTVDGGKKVNVRTLYTPGGNGIDVVVLVDSIRDISERFANTAYGFFLGKKVAYPVVANYVRNIWGKYELVRSMFSSSTGLFSFQFNFMDGLDAMLENGPWFIRNNPLILKKWHLDENLLKKDVSTVPVWVKLHGVPIMAFNKDGLSRSSYARVMIELRADVELKDNIVVAMLKITREIHYTCNVRVEVMIELRADVELKDNIVVAMLKITKEIHYTCNVRVEYE
nr:hypothetical protein [Tanacetum cinerariifolium]